MLGRIFVFLGGLLVVALFAALLIPYFVDWTDFRRDFEDEASRILGKKVVVHGRVEARLLPFPSVTLHDVRAGSDADGTPLIQVARFSMDAELAPFLSGEARIFDMRIEEPKARIRLLKDGTLDWMRGGRALIPARNVVLESVKIEGGSVEFIDEQSGRNRLVTRINAGLSASALTGPWKAEGRASVDGYGGAFALTSGEPDRASGRMPLRLRVSPDEHPVEIDLDGAISAVAGRPVYSGVFSFLFRQDDKQKQQQAAASPFAAPRTRGNFELTNERVRVSSYRMELGGADNPYVVTGEATLDTGASPEFLLTADGQQIDVSRFAPPVVVKTGKTARVTTVSARQRIEAFAALVARIPVPQVPGKATIRLPALISEDTTIRDIRIDVRPNGSGWQVVNAVALLPGRTRLEAKGALALAGAPAFNGDLLVASSQPSGLANWLTGTVDPAIRQLNAAGFSATVSFTTQAQRFENLELAIGAASLRGRLERQSEGKIAAISVDLSGDEIDLDVLKSLGGLVLGDQVGQSVFDHRIEAKFKADRFNIAGVTASQVETAFTLAGGVLSLDTMKAGDIAGAQVSAKGQFHGALRNLSGSGTLRLNATDMQPLLALLRRRLPDHPLLERLNAAAPWYANADLTVDLSMGGGNNGANAAVSGTVNGSRLSAVAKLPGFPVLADNAAISLEAVLKNQSTAILFGQAGLDPLPFDADGEGLLSLKLNGALGTPMRTEVRFSTERTHFSLGGAFSLARDSFAEGNGEIALESADIEPYLIMNAIGLPQLGGGMALKLNARLAADRDKLTVSEAKGQAAGNGFSANLAIARLGPRKVTGEVGLDSVDLGWLGEAIYGPVIDADTGALSAKPVALPSFPGLEASVAVKAGKFHAGPFGTASGVAFRFNHAAAALSLDEMSGEWLGGRVSGRLAMTAGKEAGIFRAKLSMADVNLEPLIWKGAAGPVAAGRMAVDMTAETTGRSVAEMLAAAGGSGEMRIGGLVLHGLDPAALPAILQAADALQGTVDAAKVRPLVDARFWQGGMALGGLSVPFTIGKGGVHVQNVAARTEQVALTGNGDFDLAAQTVSGGLTLVFQPGTEALAGVEPSIRLNFTGPVAAPALTTDISGLTGFLSLRAFERERRKVEALQASVIEKQRLRREAALYRFLDDERQAARERAEAEARARSLAEARARAEKAQQEEQRRQQAERARMQEQAAPPPPSPQQPPPQPSPAFAVPPTQDVIRQFLPPPAAAQ